MRISYMQIMNNLMQIGLTVSLAALVPLLLRRVLKSVIRRVRSVWSGRCSRCGCSFRCS